MHKRYGFTIVELLIVITVVGILAAIVAVSYTGITNSARESSVKETTSRVSEKVEAEAAVNKGVFPASLSSVGVANTTDTIYQYTPNPYCLTVTKDDISYSVGTGRALSKSTCLGHSLIVWNKTQPSTNPVPSGVLDSSVYQISPPSVRIGPASVGKDLRTGLMSVQENQTYRVSLYIKTASDWNGTSGNSKIRFGRGNEGTFLQACPYNGVKLSWTIITCDYTTVAADATSGIKITVGNDGSIGNIWLDDITVSRMN